jgi:hypothetical protein
MFAFFGTGDLLIIALTCIAIIAFFIAVTYAIVRVATRRNGGPMNCPHCGAKLRGD